MSLKNYTSEIPADVTMSRIERMLVSAGATAFQKLYEDGQCVAIIFEIEFEPGNKVAVRLPANFSQCLETLWRDYTKSTTKGRKEKSDFAEQAGRTAWKLVQDWVEVQIALIHLKQIEFLQAFLPYVWDGERTIYQKLQGRGFKQLAAPSPEPT